MAVIGWFITHFPFQCSKEKLEKLVVPWDEYLLQWDQMLEKVEIIKQWKDQEVCGGFVALCLSPMIPFYSFRPTSRADSSRSRASSPLASRSTW